MTVSMRWKMFPARGEPMFASWLRNKGNKRPSEKRTHKSELQEWESEGGNWRRLQWRRVSATLRVPPEATSCPVPS